MAAIAVVTQCALLIDTLGKAATPVSHVLMVSQKESLCSGCSQNYSPFTYLFEDAVSSSDCKTSNHLMMMIWKGGGGKRS